jgi:hypothetical protein
MARHDFRQHPCGWSFRAPTESDVRYVAAHMREADRREVLRSDGLDPETVLRLSVAASRKCYAGVVGDGSVACVFGASQVNLCDETATLWMLSSEAVSRRPREFAVGSLAGVDLLCRELPEVAEFWNFVDAEYAAALRWVEWLGGGFVHDWRFGRCGGVFRCFCLENPYHKKED